MITGATRSRAAILCFGGWGLQTLLHLQPRLQSIQEQRRARGVDGPDLTRVTQFAALLPGPAVDADERIPLYLRQLKPDAQVPPFYLEHLLARLEQPDAPHSHQEIQEKNWMTGHAHGMFRNQGAELVLTHSERRGRLLLDVASPVLRALNWQQPALEQYTNGYEKDRHVSICRADVFRAGMQQGIEIARLLEAHLIAPIRHDNLVPGDPFVQTTLYVVAPLFEPLASTLIWPTLVHLLNYIGQRHVSQIVGIFATGSYAGDSSRAVEDAVSYAALAELEALSGLRTESAAAVAQLMYGEGLPAGPGQYGLPFDRLGTPLDGWTGRPLFDHIYLVDREKSNQGLIRNSYELSVLVGNVLESLVTTDGDQYVEEQLGIDLRNAYDRPYSLVGAAQDYVPMDYVFQAVHEQEEKRLIREVILGAEDEGDVAEPASLADLGITLEQVMAQLVAQVPDLFRNVTPQRIEDLQVHPDFILPPSVAAELRDLPPAAWRAAFEEQLEAATTQFDQLAGVEALDQAWGLDGLHPNGLPKHLDDKRMLPATAYHMRRTFVDLLADSPAGLRQAQARLAHWQAELERERQRIVDNHASPARAGVLLTGVGRGQAEASARRQLAIRNWRARYERAVEEPSLSGALLRSTLLVTAVLLVAAAYLVAFERPIDLIADGATFLGILLGAYLGGAMAYRRRLAHLQQLRRERLALAQQELTVQLQEQVQRGLVRAYDHLAQMLREMARALEDTTEALRTWSVAGGVPPVPPVEYAATHLRRPHLNPRLWELCRSHLRAQQDREGRRSAERLQSSWRSVDWRRKLERLLLQQHEGRPLAPALHDLLRETVQGALADLSAASKQTVHDELVQTLAKECNLEHLLWRDALADQDGPVERGGRSGRRSSIQNLIHRYLESLWSNAKPAANYDVADRLAAHGIPIDFAAVWGGADSDLSETTLREFRVAALPTADPFRIALVRTVHGLTLADLNNMRRYQMELSLLSDTALAQVALVGSQSRLLYGVDRKVTSEERTLGRRGQQSIHS